MNKQDILQKIENINKHLQKEKGYYLNGGCLEYARKLQENIGGVIMEDFAENPGRFAKTPGDECGNLKTT